MTIFMDLKFSGNTGEIGLLKIVLKNFKRFKKEVTVKFVLHYQTTKLC